MNSTNDTSNKIIISYIKSLIVFQSPSAYTLIKDYVEDARKKGVEIGNLIVNSYIYSAKSLNIWFLIDYIKSLDNLVCTFRDIYDEYLYEIKMKGVDDIYNNLYDFHIIFNAINNTFNKYICDQYLLDDFGIYQSETSLITIMSLYEVFNDYFVYTMKDKVDYMTLKKIVQIKSIKYLPYIYDKIFEQFEDIYLPFY